MYTIFRGMAVYLFVLLIFRITGKRTLAEATSFDLVMLLIISETTQQAMIDSDNSITNCFLLVITLVGMTGLLALLKQRFGFAQRWLEDVPTVVVERGRWLKSRMRELHVDEDDVLEVARATRGITRIEDVKYAIVEKDGDITIIPRRSLPAAAPKTK